MANVFRNTVLCVASVALVLVAGSTAIAQGTDSGNVRVEIEPMRHGGGLYVSITNVDFGNFEYSLTDREVTGGTLTIVVADLRGDASGWSVTLTGTDFVGVDNPENAFDVSRLSLSSGTAVANPATGHASNAAPSTLALTPRSSMPQRAINAPPGTGAGIYINSWQADLTIPAGTLVGDYRATITLSITGSAPGD